MKLICALLALASAAALGQQPLTYQQLAKGVTSKLTTNQIAEAITHGLRDTHVKSDSGVHLIDSQLAMSNAINVSTTGGTNYNATTGFSLQIYSPMAWISYWAFDKHRQMKPVSLQDFSPLDVLSIVRIQVYADSAYHWIGQDFSADAANVVIQSTNEKETLQPIANTPSDICGCQIFFYDYASVEKIRDLDPKREFLISIIADTAHPGSDRVFKVKQKHFKHYDEALSN
jgi:hypothetical protein